MKRIEMDQKLKWIRVASGTTEAGLAMYERDMRGKGLTVKVYKSLTGRWVAYQLRDPDEA